MEHFSRDGVFEDINFSLCAGEVLTFFGLVGAGRTEMARALIGMDAATGGQVMVDGKPIHVTHPTDAMRHGLAYLSEDLNEK